MKQIIYKFALSLLLVSASFIYASAQAVTPGHATIDESLVIRLDTNTPLTADYSFSISTMSFKDEAAAVRYFSMCRDNILTYTVDYAARTATVHLALEWMEPRGWDVAEYNEYFGKLAERYRTTLAVVNE